MPEATWRDDWSEVLTPPPVWNSMPPAKQARYVVLSDEMLEHVPMAALAELERIIEINDEIDAYRDHSNRSTRIIDKTGEHAMFDVVVDTVRTYFEEAHGRGSWGTKEEAPPSDVTPPPETALEPITLDLTKKKR